MVKDNSLREPGEVIDWSRYEKQQPGLLQEKDGLRGRIHAWCTETPKFHPRQDLFKALSVWKMMQAALFWLVFF